MTIQNQAIRRLRESQGLRLYAEDFILRSADYDAIRAYEYWNWIMGANEDSLKDFIIDPLDSFYPLNDEYMEGKYLVEILDFDD